MGSVEVIVDPPVFDDRACVPIADEQMLVEALVAQPAIGAFDGAVLLWLTRCNIVHATVRSCCHRSMALAVSSLPLSLTIMQGYSRVRANSSESQHESLVYCLHRLTGRNISASKLVGGKAFGAAYRDVERGRLWVPAQALGVTRPSPVSEKHPAASRTAPKAAQ